VFYNMRVERCKKNNTARGHAFPMAIGRSVGRSSDIIIIIIIIMNYDITNLENGLGYRASRTADVHLLKASAFFKSYKL